MSDRICLYCGKPLDPEARANRQYCSMSHKRAATRRRRRAEWSSNYGTPLEGVSVEPPSATSNVRAETRSDHAFRVAAEAEAARSQPVTAVERELKIRQSRNSGVALPELQEEALRRAREQQAYEEAQRQAEIAAKQPYRPEDPRDPSSLGSLARRAQQSRRGGTTRNPAEYGRQARPGPQVDPAAYEAEMSSAPWRTGRRY